MGWITAEHSLGAFSQEQASGSLSFVQPPGLKGRGGRSSLGPSSCSKLAALAHKLGRRWLEERKGVRQAECNHVSLISFGKQAQQKEHRPFFFFYRDFVPQLLEA